MNPGGFQSLSLGGKKDRIPQFRKKLSPLVLSRDQLTSKPLSLFPNLAPAATLVRSSSPKSGHPITLCLSCFRWAELGPLLDTQLKGRLDPQMLLHRRQDRHLWQGRCGHKSPRCPHPHSQGLPIVGSNQLAESETVSFDHGQPVLLIGIWMQSPPPTGPKVQSPVPTARQAKNSLNVSRTVRLTRAELTHIIKLKVLHAARTQARAAREDVRRSRGDKLRGRLYKWHCISDQQSLA